MLWYRYRQVPGRQNRFPLADSRGAHVRSFILYTTIFVYPTKQYAHLVNSNGHINEGMNHHSISILPAAAEL